MSLVSGDENRTLMYKYRPDNENTLRILRNQEMYFSFVEDFNDPFDCRVTLDCKGTEEDWIRLSESLPIPIPQNIKTVTIKYLRSINFDPVKIRTLYKQHNFRTIVVYCLSEVHNNILMWSHYSNHHRGLCLGFATEIKGKSLGIKANRPTANQYPAALFDDFLPLTKVSYQNHLPKPYDIFTGDTDALVAFMKTKACDWEYEKERRIIIPYRELNRNVVTFPKESLREIIIGCRVHDGFRKEVLDIISAEYLANGYKVSIYQADLEDDSYSLRFQRVEMPSSVI
jgi:hypothetical protein